MKYAAVLTVVKETDGCSNALAAGTPTITDGRDVDQNQQDAVAVSDLLANSCEEEHFVTSTTVSIRLFRTKRK